MSISAAQLTLPILENGDRLSSDEFMRRFERMPELKKAELINGIVYMGSPVRTTQHGEPDSLIQTWLGVDQGSSPVRMPALWKV